MDPQPNSINNNYDFIMSSPQRPRNAGSTKQRIIVVVVGVLVLAVGAMIFNAVIGSNSKRGQAELLDLAAYQTELARVINIGVANARNTEIRGQAAVTKLTVLSNLAETKDFLRRLEMEIKPEEFAKFQTPSIDAQLEEARKANNFDDVYVPLINEKISAYQERLESTYNAQSIDTIKNALVSYNQQIKLVLSPTNQ